MCVRARIPAGLHQVEVTSWEASVTSNLSCKYKKTKNRLRALPSSLVSSRLLASSNRLVHKLFWCLLSVALRVVLSPSPKVAARIFERELGLPLKFLVGSGWVCCQVQNITGSTVDHLVWKIAPDSVRESLDHLEDGRASASTKIPCAHAGLVLAKVVERLEMALGEINDVNVVADCSTVP